MTLKRIKTAVKKHSTAFVEPIEVRLGAGATPKSKDETMIYFPMIKTIEGVLNIEGNMQKVLEEKWSKGENGFKNKCFIIFLMNRLFLIYSLKNTMHFPMILIEFLIFRWHL